ncbi:MAG: hypothetical protein UX13_C0021G0010 [Candidatus Woesebacteria bacterium GW2011_GWB1_45_5]|uniref:ArnT-like N-terminal domain-containing protein n=1 Tax=Candidatus Woesebacteria bacterium GW2011_GWB1_45_5 TaxID=1618581 RepID=A0A0G1QN56_9BACT|nr:MAG: hypothetical protein UX13_C0021G0010 [Candidatus Woesebacteria bacterium GW2011_GWB1_45_5]
MHIVIFILAFALRFILLTHTPPSLNWDEVSHGYNAYSILKTGMDEWGQKFPILNFRAYGDYPTPLNLYLTIPSIAVFGLTEFAVRFPHVLLGALTTISVYFLTLGITKKKNMSLLAAFLTAVGPWHVFTSRFVVQSNLSVFFLTAGMALFVNRTKNKYFLPVSFLFLFLTLFSYHTTRIFSPLILLGMLFIYRQAALKIFVPLFIVLSVWILVNPEARARGNLLFLINESAVNKIVENRNASNLPPLMKRLMFNRPVYFVTEFSKNYVSYFSPEFLFLEGGTQYQFSIPKTGLINLINLPFFYLGIFFLIRKVLKEKERDYGLLLLWLVLSPIPASLTNEKFAVLRATTILPLPEILTALGFYAILDKIPKKLRLFGILGYLITIFLSLESYMVNYFTDYRQNYSWSWQYGYKEAVSYAKDNYSKYDKIIVTKKYGEPHEFFLFFTAQDPASYRSDPNLIRFYQSGWYWTDRFDKFYFVNDWQIKEMKLESGGEIDCRQIKCLLITSPDNYPSSWSKLETINFLNGEPAFEIYNNI